MSIKKNGDSKLSNVIFYSIDRAIRAYRQYAQKQIRDKGFDITIDQWLVMKSLLENPGIKQQDLAESVFKDNASVTRIIELLVKNGYLDRSTHQTDRRMTQITITAKGKEVLKALQPVVASNRRKALQHLDDSAIEQAKELLDKIAENCKQ
ncbi:MarR family winged helix-turn-helix transcriptional regulator [Flavihumibacter sp.]|uniref:MarR family winged helix-turn-helix transcriptional regulator n=1 Tax=Flavihumibacter sp. TaxID=1913981 RepID=UPI002FCBEB51|nr:MarR family transcriptional regulator [Flavihumibacter sediminis]